MDCIMQLLICIACLGIDCTGVLVYALSLNDSVKISLNSTTEILYSNGSKHDMASKYMNNTFDDLAVRFLHGKNISIKRDKRSAACEDGENCGPHCCRYKGKITNICRGYKCWGGSVDIVARGFKFPQRLRKIFLDVIRWWRDMWYAYRVKDYDIISVRDVKKLEIGDGIFISLHGGWMSKKIFMEFSGPITITKHQFSKPAPHFLESFDLHLWNTWFGYEFSFIVERNGHSCVTGKMYIDYSNLLMKLFVMTMKEHDCAASRFQVNLVPTWADFNIIYTALRCMNIDEKMLEDVKHMIHSFVSSHLLKKVLEPAMKNHFNNFFKTSKSLVYREFKNRDIDLCKEVKYLFD